VQTGQPQPITGTPCDVPVPRNVTINCDFDFKMETANQQQIKKIFKRKQKNLFTQV
jgi:hypothetical protein